MVRKLSLAVALALGVAPFGASALGLGEIKLKSALDQYFNADIELLSVDADTLPDVKITLASDEAFERAGVERGYLLTKLKFSTVVGPDGATAIHVSSGDPIREPFLNFLIEVNWPKGRLVREYTVLLDPPVTLARKPAQVIAPAMQPSTAAAEPQRAPAPTQPTYSHTYAQDPFSSPSEPTYSEGAVADEYGPTRKNDTLWGIAGKVKQQGASHQQMMMALFQANPDAFMRNNINNLKTGQILRVPDREEVMAMTHAEARAAFSEQVQVWRADRKPAAGGVAADEGTAVAADDAVPDAELKIASARPEGEGDAGSSEGAGSSEVIEELKADLAASHEAQVSAEQEGEEMRSRVSDLESQLGDLQRLMELKDDQLAQLQAAANQPEVPMEEEVVAEEVVVEETVAEPIPEAETEVKPEIIVAPATMPEPEPVAAPEPVPVAKVEPAKSEPVSKPKKKENLLDSLMKDPVGTLAKDPTMMGIAAGGGVILLALLWILISRRRSNSAQFQESILVSSLDEADSEQLTQEHQETASTTTEETSFLSDFSPSDIDALQDETGEVDPVAEADVYIAYGRYQQAEELIRQAIEKNPDRLELHAKLFEVLYAVKNADAYIQLAEEATSEGLPERDQAAWSKVVAMGAELAADHPLFAGAGTETTEVGEFDETEIDLTSDDLSSDDLDLDELTGLDFDDLDEPEEGQDEQDDDTGLDFDLNLDASEDEATAESDVDGDLLDLSALDTVSDEAEESDDILSLDDVDSDFAIEDTLESVELDDLDISSQNVDESEQESGVVDLSDMETLEESDSEISLDLGESEAAADEDDLLSLDDMEDSEEVAIEGEGLGDDDEVGTKLDLARAYVDMGDGEGARSILEEVMNEGNDGQKSEAQALLDQLS
ncbi:MAG: FimV family protein [Gammaproteobacteria bacterium]|nr:FimV family protein [Gammaproteobacteria bacterium]